MHGALAKEFGGDRWHWVMSAILTLARNAEDGAHSYLMDQLKVDVSKQYMQGKNNVLGLGSVRSELSESTTLKMDSAGDQLCLRMSMQTFPFSEIFM